MIGGYERKLRGDEGSVGHTEGTDEQHAWDGYDRIVSSPDDPKPVYLTNVQRSWCSDMDGHSPEDCPQVKLAIYIAPAALIPPNE